MTTTPQRVEDCEYDRTSGIWRLKLPAGCGHIAPGADGDANPRMFGGLPRLPTGQEIVIDEQNAGGVGGKMWRSAGALCRWQLARQDEIRGARVLELGSGTGASGLFAAGLGASAVLLTDGQEELVPLLERNAQRNGRHFEGGPPSEWASLLRQYPYGVEEKADEPTVPLQWRSSSSTGSSIVSAAAWRFGEAPPPAVALQGPYDLVLGSDITYAVSYALEDDGVPDDRHGLCRTIRWLLEGRLSDAAARNPAPRCVIAHEHRRADMFDVDAILRNERCARWDENDSCLGIFLDSAAQHGLVVTPLALEHGFRRQTAESVVEMTTDLSVFEVSLGA
jgi:predicted nicotinamide N-methyase